MNKRLVDRIPFTKILLVLVAIFLVSLGLCGATLVFSGLGSARGISGNMFGGLVVAEAAAMVLSGIGLVLTAIVWVTLAVIGSNTAKAAQPQNLSEHPDDTKPDEKE